MTEILTRLHELNATDLTVLQVSYVLGRSDKFIYGLIANGDLETMSMKSTSGHHWDKDKDKATGTRNQPKGYLILRDAVLIYLVKSTKGGREVILHAIEESFPKSAKLCRKVAESLDAPAPENVIPMNQAGVKRTKGAKPQTENPAQLFLFSA